ncbi:MAG: hypothetical protein CVU52_09455 [Deltaproteobacteria bacterium HGW-Deltaproteobacteria-10]|nr:MAG: hypothetical protein CVU52_09455 [Deltaproteobacteria bacterium HGW-Deltaproteobacteria-10]
MLKIHCPVCRKSFLWTDDMPPKGECPNSDCEANYDIHAALKQNIERHEETVQKNVLVCPSCGKEIPSRLTICRHCGNVVFGTHFFRERYLFMGVCILLIGISLIVKYLVK